MVVRVAPELLKKRGTLRRNLPVGRLVRTAADLRPVPTMDVYGLLGGFSFGLDGGNPRIDTLEQAFFTKNAFVSHERVAERRGSSVVMLVGRSGMGLESHGRMGFFPVYDMYGGFGKKPNACRAWSRFVEAGHSGILRTTDFPCPPKSSHSSIRNTVRS